MITPARVGTDAPPSVLGTTRRPPPVRLAPRAAETLALASHELASNAVQHGALGRGRGRVRVSWAVTADGALGLEWREDGIAHPPAGDTAGAGHHG